MGEKRHATNDMRFIKPKNLKRSDHTGPITTIEGQISNVKYPHVIETYNGRAIVVINGKTVVGNLPLISKYMIYSLIVREVTTQKFGRQYEIVDYGLVPFKPMPFTYLSLKMLLIIEYGLADNVALQFVCELKQQLNGKTITDVLSLSELLKLKTPEWLVKMCNEVVVFKCEYLMKFTRLWDQRSLYRLSVKQLCDVAGQLRLDPSVFCFSWRHPFPLPEVSPAKLSLLEDVDTKPLDNSLRLIANSYNRVKAWLHQERQMFFSDHELGLCDTDRLTAIKHKVFIPIWERLPFGNDRCWYTYEDYHLLFDLKTLLGRVLARTEDSTRKQAKPIGLRQLTEDEQKPAYDAVAVENLICVTGKPGTGKTLWAEMVSKTYKKKRVLVCAPYGRMASNIKEHIGLGETILMILTRVEKDPDLAAFFEVLIIDEAPLMPLALFVRLLRRLPSLKKVILLGDVFQMPSIERGAIFEAMLQRYGGTNRVHHFTKVMRVTDPTGILLGNLDKILAAQTDLDVSDDLNSKHPFILLPRSEIDMAAEDTPWAVECVQASVAPILDRYPLNKVQILCQRKKDRDLINHAIFNLTRGATELYNHAEFHVGEQIVFTENNYGNADGQSQTWSSPVMNGQLRKISHIYDIDPFADPAVARKTHVSSTESPKHNPNWHRMIEFTDGVRVNLRHYDIANISKGYALTDCSAQGSQFENVGFYIHDRFSQTLNVLELYMVLSRAMYRCIVVGTLAELARIIKTPYVRPPCTIVNWLP